MSLTATLKNSRVPGLNEYILEHEINHGYFGRVYQGKEVSSEKRWALKFVQKSLLNDRQKRNIVREVNWNFFFFFFFPFWQLLTVQFLSPLFLFSMSSLRRSLFGSLFAALSFLLPWRRLRL